MPRARKAVLAALLLYSSQILLSALLERAFVAVVNTDGSIHPIARRDPSGWVTTWPPAEADDTPVPALEAIPREWMEGPVPMAWSYQAVGGPRRTLHVTGTKRCCACVEPVRLETDCGSACGAYANDAWASGIAVTGDLAMLPFSTAIPKEAGFARAVRAAFDAAVPAALAGYEQVGGLVAPAVGATYRDAAPVLERAYVLQRDGTTTAYVEAERRFTVENSPNLLVFSGWFHRGDGRFEPVGIEVAISHTDEDKSERREMVGVLDDEDGPTWVATITTYEHGSHALMRLEGKGVRRILSVERGGC